MTGVAAARGRATVAASDGRPRDGGERIDRTSSARGCGRREGEERRGSGAWSGRSALRMHLRQGVKCARRHRRCSKKKKCSLVCQSAHEGSEADENPKDCKSCRVASRRGLVWCARRLPVSLTLILTLLDLVPSRQSTRMRRRGRGRERWRVHVTRVQRRAKTVDGFFSSHLRRGREEG